MKTDNILNIALLAGVGFGALYLYKGFKGVGENVAKNIYDNAYDNYNPYQSNSGENPININFSTGVQDALRDKGVYTPDGTRYYVGQAGSDMTKEQFSAYTGYKYKLSDTPLNIGDLGNLTNVGIGNVGGLGRERTQSTIPNVEAQKALDISNKYMATSLKAIKSASTGSKGKSSSKSSSSSSSSSSSKVVTSKTGVKIKASSGFQSLMKKYNL